MGEEASAPAEVGSLATSAAAVLAFGTSRRFVAVA